MMKFDYIILGLIYYIAWTTCLMLAAADSPWMSTLVVILAIIIQYYWQYFIRHQHKGLNRFLLVFTSLGTLVDSILLNLHIITFSSNPFSPYFSPPWMVALWVNFSIVFYSDLSPLVKHPYILCALSFFGFSLAYAIGAKMGAAYFPQGYPTVLLIGLIWMILSPIIIYIFDRTCKKSC